MLKKPVFWLLVLLFLILAAAAYLVFGREEFKPFDVFDAVPQNAALIVKFRDLPDLIDERSDHPLWTELCNFPAVGHLDRQVDSMASVMKRYPGIRKLIDGREAVFSWHRAGKYRYDYIFYASLKDRNDEKRIREFMNEQFSGTGQLTERKYESNRITEVAFHGKPQADFAFAVSKGLFVLSHSSILLEEAVRQMDVDRPSSDEQGFREIASTAGKNVDANIYLNLKELPRMASPLLSDRLKAMVEKTGDLAWWCEMDLNIKDGVLMFNGFGNVDDTANELLKVFLGQAPQRMEIQRVIPSDFACFLTFGFSDYKDFRSKYEDYLDINGALQAYRKDMDELIRKYGIELDKKIGGFIENELAVVITDIRDLEGEDNIFYVLRCRNQSEAREELEGILHRISDVEAVHISKLIFDANIASDHIQRCYLLPSGDLGKYLFGDFMAGTANTYCTFIDHYLVFGHSKNALTKYVHLNLLQSTLDSDLDYNRLSDYMSGRSNISFYLNIPRATSLISRYFSEKVCRDLEPRIGNLVKFKAFSYQLSGEDRMFYNNSFLKFSGEVREEPRTVWESRLDQPTVMKPKLVINHYTRNHEIFIQDDGDNIYLIDASGIILWKIPCSGQINSDVFQVDYYKNGKLQYLFSTPDKIHLIDRNGNEVEDYPVSLRETTGTGLSVFDYDGNKDYRIFVPTVDRKIYVYNIEGKLVEGWEFNRTDNPVYNPVQHFRIGDKDYIECADRYKLYFLNRRGRTRISVKKYFPVSRKNPCLLDRGNLNTEPRFVMTDTLGHVHFIHTDGTERTFVLRDFSADHYFDYADLNGDGRKEYIFLDDDELEVYDARKNKLFSHAFDSPVTARPALYSFSRDDIKIGVVCGDRNEIYLINNDGSTYSGFPLTGSTMFSIGFLNSPAENFNLVVGGSDNFLYNYSLN